MYEDSLNKNKWKQNKKENGNGNENKKRRMTKEINNYVNSMLEKLFDL